MGKLGDNNFIPVYGWMLNLELKPLEVMILAIINNFEQSGNEYTGSAGYIVEALHVSKPTALKALDKLVKEGILEKIASDGGNVKNVSIYKTTRKETLPQALKNFTPTRKETLPQALKNFTPTRKETLPNNNIYNNKNKNRDKNTSSYKKEVDTKYRDNTQGETAAGVQKTAQRFQDNDFADVVNCFSNNIHPLSGQIEADSLGELFDRFGKVWMLEAIKEAALNNGRSVKYIEAILKRWDKQGKGVKKNGKGIGTDGSGYNRFGRKVKVETMQDCLEKFKGETNGWKDH